MKIEEREVTEGTNYLAPVTYVPRYANSNASHPACQRGVIIRIAEYSVFVLYCKTRTVQATNPDDLVWG